MFWDLERVRRNAQQATTEDLLDRVTVYRAGMEPEALELIEAELRRRGITEFDIAEHAAERDHAIQLPDGSARMCSFCRRPAVRERWGWHWLWGKVPVFPRRFFYCPLHRGPESDRA
jgi:hypothetical protein